MRIQYLGVLSFNVPVCESNRRAVVAKEFR